MSPIIQFAQYMAQYFIAAILGVLFGLILANWISSHYDKKRIRRAH